MSETEQRQRVKPGVPLKGGGVVEHTEPCDDNCVACHVADAYFAESAHEFLRDVLKDEVAESTKRARFKRGSLDDGQIAAERLFGPNGVCVHRESVIQIGRFTRSRFLPAPWPIEVWGEGETVQAAIDAAERECAAYRGH